MKKQRSLLPSDPRAFPTLTPELIKPQLLEICIHQCQNVSSLLSCAQLLESSAFHNLRSRSSSSKLINLSDSVPYTIISRAPCAEKHIPKVTGSHHDEGGFCVFLWRRKDYKHRNQSQKRVKLQWKFWCHQEVQSVAVCGVRSQRWRKVIGRTDSLSKDLGWARGRILPLTGTPEDYS